jgi:hypothetical protein
MFSRFRHFDICRSCLLERVYCLDELAFHKDGGTLTVCKILIKHVRIVMRYALIIFKFNQDFAQFHISNADKPPSVASWERRSLAEGSAL